MEILKTPCIQVVGYKNSGKTTLVSKLVRACSEKKIITATLKHHGHGGKPQEPEGVDSTCHLHAGASIAGVEGDGRLQLSIDNMDIKWILRLYQQLAYDFLVIEGYKQLDFPKVIMIKAEEELRLLRDLTNVRLAILWNPNWGKNLGIPWFSIEEEEEYINFLVEFAEGGQI